ncbi:MAG: hypothetical protein PWP31_1487 [Clostridia bacterium]|nr:hypothetical protein [Clostridia bacterium]
MSEKDKIEIARNILNNAAKINISKGILLKISQKIDKYIVEYYRKCGGMKQINKKKSYGDFDERENV